MYEVTESFKSRAYGDLSPGDELTESQYQMLSFSEKEKVKRKLSNKRDDDAGGWYPPTAGANSWTTSYDDTPSDPSPSHSPLEFGGSSGGGGSSDSWSDSGSSDSGGSDGGGD